MVRLNPFSFLRKPLEEYTFTEFLKKLKQGDEESRKLAEQLSQLPNMMAVWERTVSGRILNPNDVGKMKLKDVKAQINLIEQTMSQQVEALQGVLKEVQRARKKDLGEGWTGAVVNKEG